jgi:pilus assembly protein CpaF
MVLMAGMELPLKAIREQVANSIELIVHQERVRDGSRKVVKVSEVQGMESDTIVMQDLFIFDQTGIKNGVVQGVLKATGLRPHFMDKLIANNIEIPESVFEK